MTDTTRNQHDEDADGIPKDDEADLDEPFEAIEGVEEGGDFSGETITRESPEYGDLSGPR